ncbi:DUF3794 domain-containing protein [Pontibacillus sp. HMF3514]|uniref:DUF3794 domain-containing protein n=1 Tax=Pontibacillus sp. HMF3514 TaxID=2692425 RepID=UPI00131F7890|nr:DUF3794 domain-containing protein [Pontibacillus sp. HMF3514]QHE54119.1 DUF3794 domain-containing protein [Pontibacillus sp. HMF3514]
MAKVVKDLIEFEWPSKPIPEFSSPISAFKEFNIQDTLEIPEAKPDIEQLVSVKSKLVLHSTKVIKTPKAQSLERQTLTGWKLIIEAELKHVIRYVADEPSQKVHGVHFNIPFSTFIVLPPDFDENSCLSIESYIEDIYACQISKRGIFTNTTLLMVWPG